MQKGFLKINLKRQKEKQISNFNNSSDNENNSSDDENNSFNSEDDSSDNDTIVGFESNIIDLDV